MKSDPLFPHNRQSLLSLCPRIIRGIRVNPWSVLFFWAHTLLKSHLASQEKIRTHRCRS
jgi:hypothetical protein